MSGTLKKNQLEHSHCGKLTIYFLSKKRGSAERQNVRYERSDRIQIKDSIPFHEKSH